LPQDVLYVFHCFKLFISPFVERKVVGAPLLFWFWKILRHKNEHSIKGHIWGDELKCLPYLTEHCELNPRALNWLSIVQRSYICGFIEPWTDSFLCQTVRVPPAQQHLARGLATMRVQGARGFGTMGGSGGQVFWHHGGSGGQGFWHHGGSGGQVFWHHRGFRGQVLLIHAFPVTSFSNVRQTRIKEGS